MAETEIVVTNGTQGEGSRQKTNMSELYSNGFFELRQLLQGFDPLNPLPVAIGFLFLQRMTRQIHPYVIQMFFGEQTASEDLVRLLNARIEIHGTHQGLVTVGHGVF